jgi:hypothetical protein
MQESRRLPIINLCGLIERKAADLVWHMWIKQIITARESQLI